MTTRVRGSAFGVRGAGSWVLRCSASFTRGLIVSYLSMAHEPGQVDAPAREPVLGGPASVVETACPLDCPDACSLSVTVQHGKVITIDGSHKNPVTEGYICAKVRKFDQRLYGPDRLLYPAIRKGRKGEGRFKRASWDEAL